MVLATTGEKVLIQIEYVLEWDSTQAWMKASSNINAFPSRPIHVIVLTPIYASRSLAKYQQIIRVLSSLSTIIHSKRSEPSAYNLRLPLHVNVSLVHDQAHIDTPYKIESDGQVRREDETRLTGY